MTSGLDSMILGETQILGQIRDSFLLAQQHGTTDTLFNTLFKQAVTLAKRAFSETTIGENPVSISYAAVELGKQVLEELSDKNVLLIGAGKMGELTAKHLRSNGAGNITVVNRTYEHAIQLAEKFEGQAGMLEDLKQLLQNTDIVISSTGSSSIVLTKEQVKAVLSEREDHPLFMIDIAVPRDLDPAINELEHVFLYDIDDLQTIVETNLMERQRESVKIEKMIDTELESFELWFKRLRVGPVIQGLQLKSSQIHEQTFDNLMKKLPQLNDHEMKIIYKLTKSMMNQMLREPIQRMKEIAEIGKNEEVLELFAHLFALDIDECDVGKQVYNEQSSEQKGNETFSASSTAIPRKPAIDAITQQSGRERSEQLECPIERHELDTAALNSTIQELLVSSS